MVSALLQAGILSFVISPSPVAGEIREQMLTHILVFRADEPKAQQKGTEGKRRVFADLGFPHYRSALVDGLCGNRQSQRDVCPYLTGVERAFKTAPFQCAPIKHECRFKA